MKSFLACSLVVLLALDVSSGFAANNPNNKTTNPRGRGKDAPVKTIMSNFSNEEAIPDPSDEIAAVREWKDASGEHSCQAQLQSVQAGDVTLKKKDGTVSKISLPKLSKEDQDLVHAFLTRNTFRQIEKAIQAFRKVDLGDTKAKMDEKKKVEEDRLRRKINGRQVRLVFPIKDVAAPEKGVSALTLEAPELQPDGWDFRTTAKMKLSKEEALRTSSSSVLVVEGRAVIASIGEGTKGQKSGGHALENNDNNVMAYDNVQFTLDRYKMTIQRGPAKVEKSTKTAAASAKAAPAGTTKPDSAATASSATAPAAAAPSTAVDGSDGEKAVPESSDAVAVQRHWRDLEGKRSIPAEVQSVEAGSVTFKKFNGSTVNVPIAKLFPGDQELIRDFLVLSSKRKVAAAVASFLKTNFGSTDAAVAENEKLEADKLYKAVNGRQLRFVFPVKNAAVAEDQMRYKLNLGAPDFPQGSLSWRGQTSSNQNLSKEEFAKIGPSSVLIVQGKVRVEFSSKRREEAGSSSNKSRGRRLHSVDSGPSAGGGQGVSGGRGASGGQTASAGPENDAILSWEMPAVLPGGGNVMRRVLLFLDNSTTTLQHESPAAKTAA